MKSRPDNNLPTGYQYYKYILIHDYHLAVTLRCNNSIMEVIAKLYMMKEDKETQQQCGPPNMYICSKMLKLNNQSADEYNPYFCSILINQYVQKFIAFVDKNIMAHVQDIDTNQSSLFITGYFPKLDTSQ